MNKQELHGVFPVLQMPLADNDEVDEPCLDREIDFLFESGADGAVLAMASEINCLTDNARDRVLGRVVEAVAGRGPVIASVVAESTPQALRHAKAAERLGCRALMAPLPITH